MLGLNNANVRKYMRTRIPDPLTENDAQAWIDHCRDMTGWARSGPWKFAAEREEEEELLPTQYAIGHEEGELIGAIGITIKDDVYFRTAELGYWLAEPWWGKGVMSVVVKAFVEWVFGTLGVVFRIEAVAFADNAASAAVLRKAGFRSEGRKESAVWKDGKVGAEDIWGIVRREELGSESEGRGEG